MTLSEKGRGFLLNMLHTTYLHKIAGRFCRSVTFARIVTYLANCCVPTLQKCPCCQRRVVDFCYIRYILGIYTKLLGGFAGLL